MKLCAVICEYNPLHNGHRYQPEQISKITECDGIVCIMSGDFVQRAEPAIIDKITRTRCALESGADMVVQLPTLFATASGENFAKGAVQIACLLPHINYLAMGCETDSPEFLYRLAEIQTKKSDEIKKVLDIHLKKGESFPSAYAAATCEIGEKHGIPSDMSQIILSKPNNVLCLEYLKALNSQASDIQPVIIRRTESAISSSKIRIMLSQYPDSVKEYVPDCTLSALQSKRHHFPSPTTYSDIAMYKIKTSTRNQLSCTREIGEGIDYRMSEIAKTTCDLTTFLNKLKTKRYPLSRLKRICLNVVLDITSTMSNIVHDKYRLLGIRNTFKSYLTDLPKQFFSVQYKDAFDMQESAILNLEKRAHALYTLLTDNPDYSFANKLVIL